MKKEEWIARRRRTPTKLDCPICHERMTRKGSFTRKYWKCLKCGMRVLKDGTMIQPTDDALTKIVEVTTKRNETYTRRMVKRLLGKKYRGFTSFVHNGQLINLDDWDKSGLMKEEIEMINKKLEESKKKKAKKGKKKVVDLNAESQLGIEPAGRTKDASV